MKFMNKHNSYSFVRKAASYFFSACTFLLLLAPVAVHAGEPVEDTPSVRVQHSKPINGQPVFQVIMDNNLAQPCELRITDAAGTVLYTEKISSRQYSKRFQVAAFTQEDVKIYVELTSKGNRKAQAYLVEGKAESAQELVVSRF
jgi:hypothetical protein